MLKILFIKRLTNKRAQKKPKKCQSSSSTDTLYPTIRWQWPFLQIQQRTHFTQKENGDEYYDTWQPVPTTMMTDNIIILNYSLKSNLLFLSLIFLLSSNILTFSVLFMIRIFLVYNAVFPLVHFPAFAKCISGRITHMMFQTEIINL